MFREPIGSVKSSVIRAATTHSPNADTYKIISNLKNKDKRIILVKHTHNTP